MASAHNRGLSAENCQFSAEAATTARGPKGQLSQSRHSRPGAGRTSGYFPGKTGPGGRTSRRDWRIPALAVSGRLAVDAHQIALRTVDRRPTSARYPSSLLRKRLPYDARATPPSEAVGACPRWLQIWEQSSHVPRQPASSLRCERPSTRRPANHLPRVARARSNLSGDLRTRTAPGWHARRIPVRREQWRCFLHEGTATGTATRQVQSEQRSRSPNTGPLSRFPFSIWRR
jgi:hypothetical protein